MRAFAITHLNYWFWILSILERTKNSTKTSNTSFERSNSGLLISWRLRAWHSYWPATPTLYDKLTFLGGEAVVSPWCCHAPVLQEFFCPLSELSNEVLCVFVPFLLFQEIKFKVDSMEFFLTLHHKLKKILGLSNLNSIYWKSEKGRKTYNISFESPDSGQYYSWRTGAWQYHGLAKPSSPKKFNLS